MKKAFLVTFSVTTRLIADVTDNPDGSTDLSDVDVDRAFEQAQYIMRCQSSENHFVNAVEDTECPYDEAQHMVSGPSFDDI